LDADIAIVLAVLAVTVVLLVFEVFRIDLVAIMCMLALGWTQVLEPGDMLAGFSSSAVIVMMAVMIMGRGIDKTGIMDSFAGLVLSRVGTDRQKVVAFLSAAVGVLSGFVQNIGAVTLFLPGVLGVSRRSDIGISEMIMPIGYAAILGGTLTMVGSGPLILTNDLLQNANLQPYGLFSVTPVGILLVLSGVGYFYLLGRFLLPSRGGADRSQSEQERLIRTLYLPHSVRQYYIPEDSPLVRKTIEQSGAWDRDGVHILGVSSGKDVEYAPWRETVLQSGQELALLGSQEAVAAFASGNGLLTRDRFLAFDALCDPGRSGFAEVIVPSRSELVGRSIRQYALRRRYGVEPMMLFSGGHEIAGDISDHVIASGDTIVVHGLWERIADLRASSDFIVATPFAAERKERSKTWVATGCLGMAVALALSGFPVSLAFATGAIAMVLAGVLDMQEAYQAIEWRVVFLLAGLIPLGMAMQETGTARFLAENLVAPLLGGHPLLVVAGVGIVSTILSLLMTNVGAIVLMAPLTIGMAEISGLDPRPLVLMAAVCAANSFVLPTHQVNALLMSSGGYRNRDYLRAGSGMTVVFLVVAVLFFGFFMF
jgi:di/tricarboxylate transporter